MAYIIDGMKPEAVATPGSEAELAAALAGAAREGAVVCPWGAGTAAGLGNLPERVDLVLSLERLDQVIEYEPADLTMTVQAGMPLSTLQALAGRHGQMLPADPPRAESATLGGIVAAGSSGPCRMAYGGPRDWLLGARVALPDGRVIRSGGRVVKNVAGYDINKLLVGSLGTLGVLTEVTVKLRPLPQVRRTLLYGYATTEAALAMAESIWNSELLPTALTVLTPGAARRLGAPGPACVAVLLEETEQNVAHQAGQLNLADDEPGPEFWAAVRDYERPLKLQVRTKVSDLGAELAWGEANGFEGLAHVGTGTAFLYGDRAEAACARLKAPGAVLEQAPPELKRQVDVWGPERPEWQLMRAVKERFDPGRVLNRGRFIGGM